MTEDRSALVVWSGVMSAETVTSSLTSPTGRMILPAERFCEALSLRLILRTSLYPAALTTTVNVPGWTSGKMNPPFCRDLVVDCTLVSSLISVTDALGMTALVLSSTVPVMLALEFWASLCRHAKARNAARHISARHGPNRSVRKFAVIVRPQSADVGGAPVGTRRWSGTHDWRR